MRTINEIKEEQQEKLSALFKELGIFFAFSQQQFNEQKKEGVTYVAGDYGMVLPKENVQAYYDRHNKLVDEEIAEFNANVPMDDFILYELWNYECFYTGNYREIFELVSEFYPQCTLADVERVYRSHLNSN